MTSPGAGARSRSSSASHSTRVTLLSGAPLPLSTPSGTRTVSVGKQRHHPHRAPGPRAATGDAVRCQTAKSSSAQPGAPGLAAVDGSPATGLAARRRSPRRCRRRPGPVTGRSAASWCSGAGCGRRSPSPTCIPPARPVKILRPGAYVLQVSANGRRWLTVAAVTDHRSRISDTLTFPKVTARFVRVKMTKGTGISVKQTINNKSHDRRADADARGADRHPLSLALTGPAPDAPALHLRAHVHLAQGRLLELAGAVRGISSMNSKRSGICHLAYCWARWALRSSGSTVWSSRTTITASGRSPQRSSGMAMTAASATPSWAISRFSRSTEEIHSPPDLTRSLERSQIFRFPVASIVTTSPVENQPSSENFSPPGPGGRRAPPTARGPRARPSPCRPRGSARRRRREPGSR